MFDALRVANWQRSKDGQDGTNQPTPLPRPGDKRQARDKASLIEATIAERARLRMQAQQEQQLTEG